ncbi:DUF4838 domain-containing protein [Actinopolymorpha sp. B17G11]|uniref:DUF4838 domain-containing protein n=1 Tax=unclassified Actinopolymorpha TaxID=2627063 RepID=UPI0032D8FB6E
MSRRSVLRYGAAGGLVAAFAGMVPPGISAASPREGLSLVHGGRSTYAVLVASDEPAMVRRAARELAEYARRVTGGAFPLVDEDTAHPGFPDLLVVGAGNSYASRFGPVDTSQLGDDGFAVRTAGKDILITGPGQLGTLHGAYWFVESQLGVRWFAETSETVPETDAVEMDLDDLNRDYVPRFRFRQLHYGETFSGEHRHHLRLNGRRDMYEVKMPADLNVWSGYWPEDRPTFFRDLVTDRSLIYNENLLFMSPAAREQATATITRLINERIARGEDASLGIIQWDSATWQADPDSQAFNDAHGGAQGAAMFDFVNDLARRIRRVIPNARLETEAYWWSIKPPAGMTIEDNVVITMCPIIANRGKPIMDAANQQWGDYLQGWSKICKNIVLWDYQTMFSSYLMPFPQWFDGFETIRQVARIPQVQGLFIQGVWNTRGGDMSAMRTWVHSRLAWDPTLDVRATVRKFLKGYYGAAAPHIEAYLQTLWESKEANGALTEASNFMSPIYRLDVVRAADGHLAAAEAAVRKDPELVDRVAVARFNLDHVIFMRAQSYVQDLQRAGQTWDMDLVNRKERDKRVLSLSGISRVNEGGGDVGKVVDGYNVDPLPPSDVPPGEVTPPDSVSGLPADEWVDYQEEVIRIAAPWMTTLVIDEMASDHRALRMDPHDSQWGVQFWFDALPQGSSWRLFVTLRADTGSLAADTPVVNTGIHPQGVSITKTAGELSNGEYHEIELSGTYTHNPEHVLYVWNLSQVPGIWVDRVFAIKA